MTGLSPPSDATQAASPPKKRKPFLFKRQAVHRQSNAVESATSQDDEDKDESNGLALFQRSKHFFPIAAAQDEQAEQTKAQSKGQHDLPINGPAARRRKASEIMAEDDLYDVSDREKKRRASLRAVRRSSEPKTPSASGASDTLVLSPAHSDQKPHASKAKGKGLASPYSLTTPVKPAPSSSSPAAPTPSITISDDEDEDVKPIYRGHSTRSAQQTRRQAHASNEHIDLDASGDFQPTDDDLDVIEETGNPEFEEYIVRAQARNAAAQAQKEIKRHVHRADDDPSPPRGAGETPGGYDTIVQIFVTSRLPPLPGLEEMPPLIMKRKLSQNMKIVKNMYAHHLRSKGYPLPEGEDGGIFLTWKGIKIYSTTSGHSLGLVTNERGKVKKANGMLISGTEPGFHSGKLHFEAWNEASFQAYLDEREKEKVKSLAALNDEDDDEDMNSAAEQEAPQEPTAKVRLTLKSKDYEPVKLGAHLDTRVDVMLGIFRTRNRVPEDRKLSLWWDGEQLDGSMTVADAEMEDMDVVEVHVN